MLWVLKRTVSNVHDSPNCPLDSKKIEPTMFYEGINAKVFRRSITFAIAVVVASCSSSFEYTISVHAVVQVRREMCVIL